jgi:hypothetical protein
MNTEAYIGKFEELLAYSNSDQVEILELARYESFQVMGNSKRLARIFILGLAGILLLSSISVILLKVNYIWIAAFTGAGVTAFLYFYNVQSARLLRLGIPAALSKFTCES